MITANELRIGNWVLYNAGYVLSKDVETQIGAVTNQIGKQSKPIPLTPEVLEKCGFKSWSDIFWTKDSELMIAADNGWWWTNKWEPDGEFQLDAIAPYKEIFFLHQLQNLYFALTQTELNYQP